MKRKGMDISISLILTLVVAVVVISIVGLMVSDKTGFIETFGVDNALVNITLFGGG